MKGQDRKTGSSLFLVRLWQPESDDAQANWTGRVVHITSGEASNFLDLSTLAPLLLEMLTTRLVGQNRLGDHSELQNTQKGDDNDLIVAPETPPEEPASHRPQPPVITSPFQDTPAVPEYPPSSEPLLRPSSPDVAPPEGDVSPPSSIDPPDDSFLGTVRKWLLGRRGK